MYSNCAPGIVGNTWSIFNLAVHILMLCDSKLVVVQQIRRQYPQAIPEDRIIFVIIVPMVMMMMPAIMPLRPVVTVFSVVTSIMVTV